ncbi:MAG TPA: Rieske (2Fe-2S) protein [Acidobacteriaceae bacterium]|nr:Rieske (2Fe-2S) protein [Acidobacteriaceae bacterium]
MSTLVKICAKSDLPLPGQAREFSAGSRPLCIANVDGVIRALDNECPHRGGPLAEGMIENGRLICPWHAWSFDPATGTADVSQERVAVFSVSIEGQDVFVEI